MSRIAIISTLRTHKCFVVIADSGVLAILLTADAEDPSTPLSFETSPPARVANEHSRRRYFETKIGKQLISSYQLSVETMWVPLHLIAVADPYYIPERKIWKESELVSFPLIFAPP